MTQKQYTELLETTTTGQPKQNQQNSYDLAKKVHIGYQLTAKFRAAQFEKFNTAQLRYSQKIRQKVCQTWLKKCKVSPEIYELKKTDDSAQLSLAQLSSLSLQ